MKLFLQRIILGTSDAWSMSRLSQRPSVLYWRLLDFNSVCYSESTGRKNSKSYLCTIVKSVIFNWLRDCISSGYKKDITAWTNKHYHAGFSTVQIVQWPAKIAQCFTAKRKLERRQFSTSSSFAKIWSACSCEFKEYFWIFWALYHLLFDLETIGVN